MRQGPRGTLKSSTQADSHSDVDATRVAMSQELNREFNHAANASPRSGSSKLVTPAVWAVIIVALVVLAIWFAMKP
jgi:hypothetical protein